MSRETVQEEPPLLSSPCRLAGSDHRLKMLIRDRGSFPHRAHPSASAGRPQFLSDVPILGDRSRPTGQDRPVAAPCSAVPPHGLKTWSLSPISFPGRPLFSALPAPRLDIEPRTPPALNERPRGPFD